MKSFKTYLKKVKFQDYKKIILKKFEIFKKKIKFFKIIYNFIEVTFLKNLKF